MGSGDDFWPGPSQPRRRPGRLGARSVAGGRALSASSRVPRAAFRTPGNVVERPRADRDVLAAGVWHAFLAERAAAIRCTQGHLVNSAFLEALSHARRSIAIARAL